MIIKFARIDDRLIHGQVVTVWAKQVQAERIIVVSEEAANDEIRKVLLKQAAPPGIKVNVVDVPKAIRVYNNPKYENDTVFLLFTNPQEVVELVEGGIPLDSINIGGMQFRPGKKQLTRAISVDEADVKAFRRLRELNVEYDLRVLASDSRGNFEAKLNEAGF